MVVLVRPTEEGNVGATARAMANTGLSRLVLVEPAPAIGKVARAFAVGAGEILDRVGRVGSLGEALASCRLVVGTTSTRARALDVPLLTPRALGERLAAVAEPVPTALVFGPERSGLDNDELALCGLHVRIPAAPEQPTLNLAQAVLIVGYEIHLAASGHPLGAAAAPGCGDLAATDVPSSPSDEADPAKAGGENDPRDPETARPAAGSGGEPPATTAEIDGLFEHAREVLEGVGFTRDDTATGVLRDLRRLAARARLTEREVVILRGICRRTLHALERRR